MKQLFLLFLVLSLGLYSFHRRKIESNYLPKYFPKAVYDFKKNSLNDDKIELGRALFYDPLLSKDTTISCASCHSQFTAFTHTDHALSHGIKDRIGTRNAPVLLNLAWKKLFMHDGAVNHLDVQALAPIANPAEMDENFAHIIKKLQNSRIYPNLFYKAYGDSSITSERTLKAMSQFMLTLVSCNSKYDSVVQKNAIFNAQEQRGYNLFKSNCASCHKEPLLTNDQFMNNGLAVNPKLNDYGRMKVTQNPIDSLKFIVPTLRNIEFSAPYMHDGRFKTLTEVLNHYTGGVIFSKTLSKELAGKLRLTSNEKVDIVVFLMTLTDKKFLFNPNYSFPKKILLP